MYNHQPTDSVRRYHMLFAKQRPKWTTKNHLQFCFCLGIGFLYYWCLTFVENIIWADALQGGEIYLNFSLLWFFLPTIALFGCLALLWVFIRRPNQAALSTIALLILLAASLAFTPHLITFANADGIRYERFFSGHIADSQAWTEFTPPFKLLIEISNGSRSLQFSAKLTSSNLDDDGFFLFCDMKDNRNLAAMQNLLQALQQKNIPIHATVNDRTAGTPERSKRINSLLQFCEPSPTAK
ncbi:hypothetical protein [Azotosporobacter soli]|uniref:hypothetical protein n=1 Tax=Azotosporobacter soli TaxID=3055040 RepID=UPI0031FEB3AE